MASLISALRQKVIQQPALLRRLAHSGSAAESKPDVWKWMTFIFVPAWVGLTALFVYRRELQHHAHHKRPEYIEYAHVGIRTKAFPWGDGNHSLFHNPKTNALPGVGYEED